MGDWWAGHGTRRRARRLVEAADAEARRGPGRRAPRPACAGCPRAPRGPPRWPPAPRGRSPLRPPACTRCTVPSAVAERCPGARRRAGPRPTRPEPAPKHPSTRRASRGRCVSGPRCGGRQRGGGPSARASSTRACRLAPRPAIFHAHMRSTHASVAAAGVRCPSSASTASTKRAASASELALSWVMPRQRATTRASRASGVGRLRSRHAQQLADLLVVTQLARRREG
jgi:hypothetical protein